MPAPNSNSGRGGNRGGGSGSGGGDGPARGRGRGRGRGGGTQQPHSDRNAPAAAPSTEGISAGFMGLVIADSSSQAGGSTAPSERTPEAIAEEATRRADQNVEELLDQACNLEEFLVSLDKAKAVFASGSDWHGGGLKGDDVLRFISTRKLGIKCDAIRQRSRTVEELKANLRREYARELKEIQEIKKQLENGTRYKHLIPREELHRLPKAIEDDYDKIGEVDLTDGWVGALKHVLPADIHARLLNDHPISLSIELRDVMKARNDIWTPSSWNNRWGYEGYATFDPPSPPLARSLDTTQGAGTPQRAATSIVNGDKKESNGVAGPVASSDSKGKSKSSGHLYATADFCLLPMGTTSSSVGEHIAECARVLETFTKRGLTFKMHGYGTNLEGPWQIVSLAIEACHSRLHEQGVPRIATDIRIGTKADHLQKDKPEWAASLTENERKLESVQRRLRGETAS